MRHEEIQTTMVSCCLYAEALDPWFTLGYQRLIWLNGSACWFYLLMQKIYFLMVWSTYMLWFPKDKVCWQIKGKRLFRWSLALPSETATMWNCSKHKVNPDLTYNIVNLIIFMGDWIFATFEKNKLHAKINQIL